MHYAFPSFRKKGENWLIPSPDQHVFCVISVNDISVPSFANTSKISNAFSADCI